MTFLKSFFNKKDDTNNMQPLESAEMLEDPIENEIRALGKQATQHKKNKEWDEAINCLMRVQELMSETGTSYTIQNKLRLAKYYMYAGRYDQALAECSKFINKILKDKQTRFEVKEFTNRDFVEVEKAYMLMSQIANEAGDAESARLYQLNAIFFYSASIKMDENSLIKTEEDILERLDAVIPKDYSRDNIIKLWVKSLM